MEISKGFYDLCVPHQNNEKDMIAILNELYEGICGECAKFGVDKMKSC